MARNKSRPFTTSSTADPGLTLVRTLRNDTISVVVKSGPASLFCFVGGVVNVSYQLRPQQRPGNRPVRWRSLFSHSFWRMPSACRLGSVSHSRQRPWNLVSISISLAVETVFYYRSNLCFNHTLMTLSPRFSSTSFVIIRFIEISFMFEKKQPSVVSQAVSISTYHVERELNM